MRYLCQFYTRRTQCRVMRGECVSLWSDTSLLMEQPGGSCAAGECFKGDTCRNPAISIGRGDSLACQCGLFINGVPLDTQNMFSLGDLGRNCACPPGMLQIPTLRWDDPTNRWHSGNCVCPDGKTLWNNGSPGGRQGSSFACYPSCPAGQVLSSSRGVVGCYCDTANGYSGTVPYCQKCPSGCTATGTQAGGCICGASSVYLTTYDGVFNCPEGQIKTMDMYTGASPSVSDLCKCPQYTISPGVCTTCSGPLQIKNGGSCSCPAGMSFTSDYSACACPASPQGAPQFYDRASGACTPCRGQAVVGADGASCNCVSGAVVQQGVCACDSANNFGLQVSSTTPQCVQCTSDQVISNGMCTCDADKGFTRISGQPGQSLVCRACPSDGIPIVGTSELCQCTTSRAHFAPSTFTCITCTGNDYWDETSGSCKTCPAGSATYGNGCQYICRGSNAVASPTGCRCLPGFAPAIPGDTSTSLSCTACATGYAVSAVSGQCALCPVGNGIIVSDGSCTCDLQNGYGFGTHTGTGPYFSCQRCPANSTPSMEQQQLAATCGGR